MSVYIYILSRLTYMHIYINTLGLYTCIHISIKLCYIEFLKGGTVHTAAPSTDFKAKQFQRVT